MLDVTERLVVIVGGGAVAARKASGVLECGARRVRVVAPSVESGMPANVERVEAAYEPRHLAGAGLVFAATDSPAVNQQVVRDARERGVLVCRVDDADEGDFVTPARFREGEVTVTVSAGSPALAVAIRDDLIQRMDRGHMKMAHAMQTLRPLIRASGLSDQRRAEIFRDLAAPEVMTVIEHGGEAALWNWIRERYPELKL